jgi:GNAT superfamily N-acetyltransferase
MNIRKFKASDAEKCSEVILKSMNGIKDLEDVERKYVSEHATPQYLLGEIKKRKYFVCEDNVEIVGIGCLDKDIIRTMYLLPAFQNKGVGSLIIERIEKEAKKDKIAKLSLFARPRVFNFYKKHGFKIIKQMPLGLYLMEKEL